MTIPNFASMNTGILLLIQKQGDKRKLKNIKNLYPASVMSGSGSTYFSVNMEFSPAENYWVANNLKTTANGICIAK